MTPLLEDNTKPSEDVKTASSTPDNNVVSSASATYSKPADPFVSPLKNRKQDAPTNATAQGTKTLVTLPFKNAPPAAPQKIGAKLENHATPNQLINKGPHAKGGFVHTLTANDGTKAQVYLSKNGAHAGIVFRNQISRGMFNHRALDCLSGKLGRFLPLEKLGV